MFQHQKKASEVNTPPDSNASGNSAIQLQDNRQHSVLQKKINEGALHKPAALLPIQQKANNTGLPNHLKSGIENLSGHSMDDVKVHYNSDKPAQLNAHAYAQGTDIHVASGQEKHLPHEAWHVVQQKQGRVKPTLQMKGKVNINDDKGLEKEADVMGNKAKNISGNSSPSSKLKPFQTMPLNNLNHKGIAPMQFQEYNVSERVVLPFVSPIQLMPVSGTVVQFTLKDTLILVGSYLGVKPSKQAIAAYFGITVAMLTSYIAPLIGLGAFLIVTMLRAYGNYYRKGLHDAAVAQNLLYKQRVVQIAQAGRIQNADLRLKNSSEWLLLPVTQMDILSPTGDSDFRVTAAMKNPRSNYALFGSALQSGAADYDWDDLHNNSSVHIEPKGQLGTQTAGRMTLVMTPGISTQTIEETIKHEVQHDADEHRQEKGDDALIGYETEYRAYSYQGGILDTFSSTKKIQKEGYNWTAKQYKIFTHIRANYSYVKEAWDNPNKIKRDKFRKEVVAYKNPDTKGVNKNNSPRVTNFWMMLSTIPAGLKNPKNEDYVKLINLSFNVGMNVLTKVDAQYILNEGKTIQDKIKGLMPTSGKAYKQLMTKLRAVQ